MDALTEIDYTALIRLKAARERLTPQQYKTLRGQVLAGDGKGALRGLNKILTPKEGARHEPKTRQRAGRRPGQQPKDENMEE